MSIIELIRSSGKAHTLGRPESEVVDFPWKEDAGFLAGEVVIAGRGTFAANRYRVQYKN